jgi:hypothetical protein
MEKLIINKPDLKFKKVSNNIFCSNFQIKNENLILSKIINFDLIKMIYDLNPDIYESVELKKENQNEAICLIIVKHLFEDLGLPQRYIHVKIKRIIENNNIIFKGYSIYNSNHKNIPENACQMPIKQLIYDCNISNEHNIDITQSMELENITIPSFAEKILGMMIYKIFKRAKLFIEKL